MSDRDTLYEQRLRKAEALRALGHDPYANDWTVDTTVAAFLRQYQALDGEALDGTQAEHRVAGRVMAHNSFGRAAFLRIQDATSFTAAPGDAAAGRLQLYVRRDDVGEDAWAVFKQLDVGDFVGASGVPMRTKTGELTLAVRAFRILTKTLRPLPEKWHGLADVEIRHRQRYLDLIANPEVRAIFEARSRIVAWLRARLAEHGFLEVETPMMQGIAGGAAARPFVTHHNALDLDLFLRVAPELYLKRLVVGGLERVFEINRNFRNEGLSAAHNPEFTMLECYQAYATFHDMLALVEELVAGAATMLGLEVVAWQGHTIRLARPFARLTMLEAIAQHGGPEPAAARDPEAAGRALAAVGVDPSRLGPGARIVALFEHFAEAKLVAPTFVYDFPAEVSPLSRRRDDDPDFVDRFELFVGGREIANAFSELNDPVDQAGRFAAQEAARAGGDREAHGVDHDYVRALEHGMPPTAGFGMGIDRLVMLLTGATSIREVILFPQLRPER